MKKILTTLPLLLAMAAFGSAHAQSVVEPDSITAQTEARFLINPEFPASYPYGEEELQRFIRENLEMPKKGNCAGTVYVEFTVEEDGSLTHSEVVDDIGCGCGKKALRMVAKMPKWTPGTINNKPVRSRFILAVEFPER